MLIAQVSRETREIIAELKELIIETLDLLSDEKELCRNDDVSTKLTSKGLLEDPTKKAVSPRRTLHDYKNMRRKQNGKNCNR